MTAETLAMEHVLALTRETGGWGVRSSQSDNQATRSTEMPCYKYISPPRVLLPCNCQVLLNLWPLHLSTTTTAESLESLSVNTHRRPNFTLETQPGASACTHASHKIWILNFAKLLQTMKLELMWTQRHTRSQCWLNICSTFIVNKGLVQQRPLADPQTPSISGPSIYSPSGWYAQNFSRVSPSSIPYNSMELKPRKNIATVCKTERINLLWMRSGFNLPQRQPSSSSWILCNRPGFYFLLYMEKE